MFEASLILFTFIRLLGKNVLNPFSHIPQFTRFPEWTPCYEKGISWVVLASSSRRRFTTVEFRPRLRRISVRTVLWFCRYCRVVPCFVGVHSGLGCSPSSFSRRSRPFVWQSLVVIRKAVARTLWVVECRRLFSRLLLLGSRRGCSGLWSRLE